MVKAVPSSIVTMIHWQSGTPCVFSMMRWTTSEYTRTGLVPSRHQRIKSMSCVASITAGESWIRPPILLPMERETLRITDGKFAPCFFCQRNHFVRFIEREPHRFLQQRVLARQEAVLGNWVVRGLGSAADKHRVDIVPAQKLVIIRGRRLGPGFFADACELRGINLGNVHALHQGIVGTDPRPDLADPSCADDSNIDLPTCHLISPS